MRQASENCILTIKSFEDLRLSPHFDTLAKIWDIGFGTTIYPNGNKVSAADKDITLEEANQYLMFYVHKCERSINSKVTSILNQNQFDALVIFIYNVGIPAFESSTLLKVINKDPNDIFFVQKEWMKWVYSRGNPVDGLKKRRNGEFALYLA